MLILAVNICCSSTPSATRRKFLLQPETPPKLTMLAVSPRRGMKSAARIKSTLPTCHRGNKQRNALHPNIRRDMLPASGVNHETRLRHQIRRRYGSRRKVLSRHPRPAPEV